MAFTNLFISGLFGTLVQHNITLRKTKHELEQLVCTDPLTGLFHEVEKMIQRYSRFILWFIDLNYFKQINDTFGHNVGDMVLVGFCNRVQRRLNDASLFARISGDEFILISPLEEHPAKREFWDKLAQEGNDPIVTTPDGMEIYLTFSKGKALMPEDGETIDELILHADKRMYKEKNARYATERHRRITDYETIQRSIGSA